MAWEEVLAEPDEPSEPLVLVYASKIEKKQASKILKALNETVSLKDEKVSARTITFLD
jgi:hypothetical protein